MPLNPMTKEEHEKVKASIERQKRCNNHIIPSPKSPIASSYRDNGRKTD